MLVFTDTTTQQILETALDAIIIIDNKSVVQAWNGSAETIFGYSKDEAIGARLSSLIIPKKLVAPHEAGVARYMATGHGPLVGTRTNVIAQRSDGTLIDVELALDVIRNQPQVFFIARCRDVTERRLAKEQTAVLVAQIAEANRELHHWVGNTLQITLASLRLQTPEETRRTIDNLAQQYRAKFNIGGDCR